jgi:protein-disulfide isomerase
MPTRKSSPKLAVVMPKLKKPSFEFLNRITSTHILVTLLIVGSFLLGSFYTKLQYLENGTNGLGSGQQPQAQAVNPTGAAAPVTADVKPGDYPVKGDPNAKVTIIEFADLRCPFCKKTFDEVDPQIQKDYIDTGKVKVYFRNWAFLGPASTLAANAAECANEQNKFWEFHDYMYKNQPDESDTSMYTNDNLTTIAGTLGIDTTQFKSCLDSTKYNDQVNKDYAEGQTAGVSGTPTFYVNGTQLVGAQPYSAFQSAIDAALKQ